MKNNKIGTFLGVFVPNVTMMFGVIFFLRLGLIVSHTGIIQMLFIIGLSLCLMLITSASIAAVATNMKVGGGGAYYLITRTLGIEIGGALGVTLFISQLLSIALTITGFAYLFVDIFPQYNPLVIEVITLIALVLVSSYSSKFALQLQVVILGFILLAVLAIFFGSAAKVDLPVAPKPFYAGGKLKFWQAFALFYPALTNIEAAMALSGKLKNPGRSLMLGNALSLVFTACTYSVIVIFVYFFIPTDLLISDEFALREYARPSWAVTIGIIAAALSSALGCILAAPRILESMALDGVVPPIFKHTFGRHKEPLWALFFTTVCALAIMFLINIDQIIPILTIICLIAYGLLNLVAGLGSLMNAPSWRPKFRVPYGLSLFGTFFAIFLMFMINPKWGIIGILLVLIFYFILSKRNLNVGFQDFRSSLLFFISRLALYRLSKAPEHAYTWHPKVLLILQSFNQNMRTLWLSHFLTQQTGILACTSIVTTKWNTPEKIHSVKEALEQYLKEKGIFCISQIQPSDDLYEESVNLINTYGMGPIQPNTIILPIRLENWDSERMIPIFNACHIKEKNLILIHDTGMVPEKIFSKKSRNTKKQIDLWWSSNARESFDLLVGYVTMLHDSEPWKQATINLRAIVTAQEAVSNLKNYLKEFVSKSRLKMKVHVHMEMTMENEMEFIPKYSKKSKLTFIPFKGRTEEEKEENYNNKIESYFKKAEALNMALFVCSYDRTEHSEIYTYPYST